MERKKYTLSNLEDSNKTTYGKRKGAAGEMYAKYRAMMDGYIVSSEESDAFDFDFLIFNEGKHYGVQAKATTQGSKRAGTSAYSAVKRVRRHENGKPKDVWMPYQHVDIFAFVDLRYDIIAWIPFRSTEGKTKWIMNQSEHEHWTLDKIIGLSSIDLNVEEYLDDHSIDNNDIGFYCQQDLFNQRGENNG